jgi:DNA polymerase-3 subunit beta
MKFLCTKENLVSVLNLTAPLTGKNMNLPVLTHILLSANESNVECAATNLEIAIRGTLRAKVEIPGAFAVPAKTLFDFISLLPDGQVEVELIGNELSVKSGSSRTKIKGTPADEYPVIPPIEEKQSYAVSAEALRHGIMKTAIAAAKNDIRPELAGIFFGFFTDRYQGLLLAATDSYRLAEHRVLVDQGQAPMRCIVPIRAAYELGRMVSLARAGDKETLVRILVGENQLAARYDSFEIITRLVDGNYPDYAQIIPSSFKTTALFPRDVMVNRIKAAGIFAAAGIGAVSFDVNASGQTVAVSSTSTQMGEYHSEAEAEITGQENSVLLNHRYVLEGLQQMSENAVAFKMNGSDTPCLLQENGDASYLYIVMPIRQ